MTQVCAEPGCPDLVDRGYCVTHRREQRATSERRRPNATDRGYDQKWRRNRARFLKANPDCVDCGKPATVADHDPVSRRDLVAAGDPHPDAWPHLKARCDSCHNKRTGHAQPGGWNAR